MYFGCYQSPNTACIDHYFELRQYNLTGDMHCGNFDLSLKIRKYCYFLEISKKHLLGINFHKIGCRLAHPVLIKNTKRLFEVSYL